MRKQNALETRNGLLWRRGRSQEHWEDDSGDWQALNGPTESPRYQTIARMIHAFCPRPISVLDVGCGEGILKDHLPPSTSYFGIEPSRKASSSAKVRAGRECIFCGTAGQFDARGRKWTAIIFNEMLYYTPEPVEIVRRLNVLTPGGIRIVSIFQKPESVKQRLSRFIGRPSMSNLRCTELVLSFAAEQSWRVEANELVKDRWRIFTMRS